MRWTCLGTVLFVVVSAPTAASAAAGFVIDTVDPAGEGLNDTAPATAVGGNSGTTLGAQRRFAVQYAADIWGALLDSSVPIALQVSFKAMPCSDSGTAALGQASPAGAAMGIDTAGADPAVYYPSALANRLVGYDLFPEDPDVLAQFNGAIGSAQCLPDLSWYYGLDGKSGEQIDLVTVVLHELSHGLGFTNLVNMETGALIDDRADVYTKHTYDLTLEKSWDQMSNQQRLTSARNARGVVWNGPAVTAEAPRILQPGSPTIAIAPPIAGFSGLLSEANFGPALSSLSAPITAELKLTQLVNDGLDKCQIAEDLTGKVSLIFDTEVCHFGSLVNRAEISGALALLIAREIAPDRPPTPLDANGQDLPLLQQYIGIPALTIPLSDATLLKTALASLNTVLIVTLSSEKSRLTGADGSGKVFLNATSPIDAASSIVHWDPLVRPNLLMEPALVHETSNHQVDLALSLLRDIGWTPFCSTGPSDPGGHCPGASDGGPKSIDACVSCQIPETDGGGGRAAISGLDGGNASMGGATALGSGGSEAIGAETAGADSASEEESEADIVRSTQGNPSVQNRKPRDAADFVRESDSAEESVESGSDSRDGCGCRIAPTRSPHGQRLMWAILVLVVALARRRHKRLDRFGDKAV